MHQLSKVSGNAFAMNHCKECDQYGVQRFSWPMLLTLALLYVSGDAMKIDVGFSFVIFVATNTGICI